MSKQLSQAQLQLYNCSRVFRWNKILMMTLGLWPASPNNFLFNISFGYFCYQMVLEYLDLFLFIDSAERVLMNLTENMAFTQIFIRILMLRTFNSQLGEVIEQANKDFDAKDYTDEERKTFISYHMKSITFMKLLIVNTALTASSYYVKPILGQMSEIMEYAKSNDKNSSFVFMLPYRFYTFYELKDASTYFWTYGSQLPFVFVSGFGQSAADCLMVTLVYHISGQMAVLSMRISSIDTDPSKCTAEVRKVVRAHIRLLRMGQVVQNAFSATLLAHFICATALQCILGYQILLSLDNGEKAVLISFFAFIFLVLLVLYAHCTVGESLITESDRVSEAFYNCKWYNMSKENTSIIILCLARAQKPMQLKAGKFNTFCLATLTISIKTSMGYLSVLRAVM